VRRRHGGPCSGEGAVARSSDRAHALGGSSNLNCGAHRAGPISLAILTCSGIGGVLGQGPLGLGCGLFIFFVFSTDLPRQSAH
jgi:hypothetical protein